MFPLNAVIFPGLSLPLNIFEERYRALVHRLLRIEDPADRVFGTVAIREGYEVGERGGQSVHRVGCLLQLTEAEQRPDGSFAIEAVGRQRLRLASLDNSELYLVGTVDLLDDPPVDTDAVPQALRALAAFERYRSLLSEIRGESVLEGDLPADPGYLSWTLAATCMFTLDERQRLLETADSAERLAMLTELIRDEVRAMAALPSLPATDVARTGWSPN